MMRTGIFGGTFNPVHNGHVKLAQTYCTALELDRLLVIPTYSPPHKSGAELASGADRLAMCRLAFEEIPECRVSDIELRRKNKSYTVDTLESLHSRFPEEELYLLLGSDMFETLPLWHCWQRIFQLAVICAGARQSHAQETLERCAVHMEQLGARCRIVQLEPVEVSSTQVRQLIAAGKDLGALVPEPVADYIAAQGLYGAGSSVI